MTGDIWSISGYFYRKRDDGSDKDSESVGMSPSPSTHNLMRDAGKIIVTFFPF